MRRGPSSLGSCRPDAQAGGAGSFGLAPYVRVEDFVEEDGTYVLRAEMPGVDPEKDVQVSVAGGVLSIAGERRQEEHDRGRHELHYGAFTRQVPLPRNARTIPVQRPGS